MAGDDTTCPYCGAPVQAFERLEDVPSESFDVHGISVECGKCGRVYEIRYRATNVLNWDEDGEAHFTDTEPVIEGT